MMGIFLWMAWFSWSMTEFVSSAASAMAAGFFAMALTSICTWGWMSASEGGPSKVISTPYFFAAASAPLLTVCQNWCWNPLEMTGMYIFSPVAAAPCSAPPSFLPPAKAGSARAIRSTAATSSTPLRTEMLIDTSSDFTPNIRSGLIALSRIPPPARPRR